MTKKEMFTEIRNRVADNEEMVAFIDHEIELLSKKRNSSSPTKKQVENEKIKESILETLLKANERQTVKEIEKVIGTEEISHARITALLTQLKKAGKVVRTEEKKVAYYELA